MPASGARTAKRNERGRPHTRDIDRSIAARIRERRVALGFTQSQLAELLGITYQQLHKYEKGVNRVAAGRLYTIAQALGVEVGYFFDGLERTSPTAPTPKQRQMLELTRHFIGLSRRQQQVLCELARVLAGAPESDGPEPDESNQAA